MTTKRPALLRLVASLALFTAGATSALATETTLSGVTATGEQCGTTTPRAALQDGLLALEAPLALKVGPVPQGQYAFANGRCDHALALAVPAGKQIAVTAVKYLSQVDYGPAAGGFHGVTLSYVGQAGNLARSTAGVSGPASGYRTTSFLFDDATRQWSPCGGDVTLVLRQSATVRAQGGSSASLTLPGLRANRPTLTLDITERDCPL